MAESAANPDQTVCRDSKTGRFVKGTSGGPGRPSGRSLTEALRHVVDPDAAARLLWKRALKSDTVLMYTFDRMDGRPKQSVDVHEEKSDAWYELQRSILEAAKGSEK